MPDPKTEELRVETVQRELAERQHAEESAEPADERTHERRAERAAYLRKKLDERARSEDDLD